MEFEDKIREDKNYLKSIIEKAKIIEYMDSTFYYIKKNKETQIFFFGSQYAKDSLNFLYKKFKNNFTLHIFDKNYLN